MELQNPIALLSLNVLGFGIDISYGNTADAHVITICANFAFGCYSKVFARQKNV